jgi:hypothetical protein
MNTQPWLSRDNKLNYLWTRDLFEAIDRGVITREYVAAEVEANNVRPSLLYQIDHRIEDAALLPTAARSLDGTFVPPHRRGTGAIPSVRAHPLRFARAALRQLYHQSFLHALGQRIRRRVSARCVGEMG